MTGLLLVAVAGWLGYAFGRGQSLADVARLSRDQASHQYTVDNGQLIAQFALMGGAWKPLIRLPDGTSLLDYSDWDFNSAVIVDGQRFEMARLAPNASADYPRNRIVSSLRTADWLLSRQIDLEGDEALVRFTFLANKRINEVRVTLAHANWYYFDVKVREDGFSAGVPRATRQEVEAGLIREASYIVDLTATGANGGPPRSVRLGSTTPYGVQTVLTEYLISQPTIGDYVEFATERLRVRPATPPGA